MRVPIVEDDVQKLGRISGVLRECGVNPDQDVDYCADVNTARARLLRTRYDLLVLDIALPTAIDAAVRAEAGIDLLGEITDRDQYKMPRHIIGLTGNEAAL